MGFFSKKGDTAKGAAPQKISAGGATVMQKAGDRVQVKNVSGADFQLALQWEMSPGAEPVDLDASAVAINGLAKINDAAYYNQLRAVGGALVHHGDSLDGSADGDDEVIDVDIAALAKEGVCTVALAVFAPNEGSLTGLATVTAVLRTKASQGGSWVDVAQIPLSKELLVPSSFLGVPTGVLVGGLSSADKGKTWWLTRLGNVMYGPRNFQEARFDLAEDCVGAGLVTRPLAKEMSRTLTEHCTFNMHKGDVASVPSSLVHSELKIGLGWTTRKGSGQIDLDASVLLLGAHDASGYRPIVDTVWHNDTQAPGVVHSGDNRTGVGDGDDEDITVNLQQLARNVERLVVVINAHTGSFEDVTSAHARVFHPAAEKKGQPDVAHYDIEPVRASSVVLCAFDRRSDGEWAFEAIGRGCEGRTAKAGEVVDAVRCRPHLPVRKLSPGESFFLPPSMYDDEGDRLTILDEWSCRGGWMWLDATLLLFDRDGKKLGEVDFNDKRWPAGKMFGKSAPACIEHSGDRKDESGKCGSHAISIKMLQLTRDHPQVFSVLLVISAYSRDLTAAVKPLVMLRDADDAEVARFEPDANYDATSVQMVDLHRCPGGGWEMTAHGLLGHGRANQYEPIIKDYRVLLDQIVDHQKCGSPKLGAHLGPVMNYGAVGLVPPSSFKKGAPFE